jgi:hypothetical protein
MAQQAKIITLYIELEEIVPPIWRRIVVDDDITLRALHHIIQAAFGWTDSHLHEFNIEGRAYAMLDNENVLEIIEDRDMPGDDRKGKLQKLIYPGQRLDYQYDFGDNWRHTIKVEKIDVVAEKMGSAHIIDGQRAAPPEDVGGVSGYEDFLTEIQDPSSEQGRDYLRWVDGSFDPELFDRRVANNALLRMAWNGWGKK